MHMAIALALVACFVDDILQWAQLLQFIQLWETYLHVCA